MTGRGTTGTTLLLLVPLVPLALFGVARASAPVSILGFLQRLTDFHPPTEERIERVKASLRRTAAGTRATHARQSG